MVMTMSKRLKRVFRYVDLDEEHERLRVDVEECAGCGGRFDDYHVLGCDLEDCPVCGDQYLWCDCVTESKIDMYGGRP